MRDVRIAIALASYNGEKYIEEQITSIQKMHNKNWELIIRDDGSTDNTLKIINDIQAKDKRIILLESNNLTPLGHCQNFNAILEYIYKNNYDYFLLADQDDYWCPEKLDLQLDKFIDSEISQLVHTDLEVVDERLVQLKASYFKSRRFNQEFSHSVKHLLMENCITGCTIMGNRKLLEVSLPIPTTVNNHDWWLGLMAVCTGSISFINKPLTKYRQHTQNIIGGKGYFNVLKNERFSIRKILRQQKNKFQLNLKALDKLLEMLKNNANNKSVITIKMFIKICSSKHIALVKIFKLYGNGYKAHRLARWLVILFCF